MKFAFVFPGQGSQSVGMLDNFLQHSIVQDTLAEASDALDYDMAELINQGPEEVLNQTNHTQPALLSASVAIYRIWQTEGGAQPAILAGHSLGEYSALVAAKAIDFATALRLVAQRGRYMQQAVPEGHGAMAALIGMNDEDIVSICEQAAKGQSVGPANFNSVGQTVIAGDAQAVQRAMKLAEPHARMVKQLTVSVPSHCTLMQPAAEALQLTLSSLEFSQPQIPVINNVDVTVETSPEKIKHALVRQLYSPVRWVETVQKMIDEGVEHIIECGAGRVLTGLNKRINRSLSYESIENDEKLETLLKQLS